MNKLFNRADKKQCLEFGQMLVLVSIGLGLYLKISHFALAAFWLMILTMTVPRIFFPLAVLWFGLTDILNRVSSWLILHIVFFILVVPVGLIRKWSGKDSMRLKQFKKSGDSVFTNRDHTYTSADLKNTF